MRVTVPSAKRKQFYKGAPFPVTASTYLWKNSGCKKLNSMTLVCDGNIDK